MAAKRLFYITNQSLTLYLSDKQGVRQIDRYDVSPESLQRFTAQLAAQPDTPTYALTDLIEEEYRNEALPHVVGSDRKALVERKLGQLFRGTRYRTALRQGRQKKGRRDDEILFTSLSNAEGLNYWLDKVAEAKTPLAGIYSLPLLSQALLQKLKINQPNTLLISQQSNDMLRQTFFNDFYVKSSRLSHLSGDSDSVDLDVLLDVIKKNQRYLHRLRLLPLGSTLSVYFLAHPGATGFSRDAIPDTEELTFSFIDIDEAAEQIGFKSRPAGLQSDLFFVWLLSRVTPAGNYAPLVDRRYYMMHTARRLLVQSGIAATCASLAWGGFNLYRSAETWDDTVHVQAQAKQLEQHLAEAIEAIPPTPLPPYDLQNIVETTENLALQKANPEAMMIAISRALAVHPHLQLDEIEWQVAEAPLTDDAANQLDDDTETNQYQQASLTGHIRPFQEDFHKAFELVTDFVNSLRRDRAFVVVEPVAMPLDTDPASLLNGDVADNRSKTAQRFEIRAVLKVDGDAI